MLQEKLGVYNFAHSRILRIPRSETCGELRADPTFTVSKPSASLHVPQLVYLSKNKYNPLNARSYVCVQQ